MIRSFSYLAWILLLSLLCSAVDASHNRAGEITYKWLYGKTYEFTVVTYTKDDSDVDRCKLDVHWGDGDSTTLMRSNGLFNTACAGNVGEGEIIANNVRMNVYIGQHTYPAVGIYMATMKDPNRNKEVANMSDSYNTPFFIFLTFEIGPSCATCGLDSNSSPIILNPPIDEACSGKLFVHNAGAYDLEGDSISYEIGDCYEGQDPNSNALVECLGYVIPADIHIDAVTGDLIWNTPPPLTADNDPSGNGYAEYNICFKIVEYRDGEIIGQIQRDMQITVWPCENEPPVIIAADTCVLAGDTISVDVRAIDPDSSSANITLSASGGPLILTNSPATFLIDGVHPPYEASGTLTWQTNCSHVRKQPHTVVFKVEDNHPGPKPEVSLVDFESIGITVIGPAPTNPISNPSGNNIDLSWDVSGCSEVVAYKIYRRNGSFTGTIDCPCDNGVPDYAGYDLLATVSGLTTITYLDDNDGAGLIHGVDYCYRIVACYPDGAESCASVETCSQLTFDVPIVTHVSVGSTDVSTGVDTIRWSMPKLLDDSIQFKGPYHYDIYRSDGVDFSAGSTFIGATASMDSLWQTDTLFIDNGLDTETGPHAYQITLHSATGIAGSTHIASSMFLSLASSDNRLDLTWPANIPWTNTQYYIYRLNDVTLLFDLIDSTSSTSYSDSLLKNEKEYCYFIRSKGSYSVVGIINPIINYSQEACGIPIDKTPPCSPSLAVTANCDDIENTLEWNNPNNSCADDVMYYNIYYTPNLNGNLELLQNESPASQTTLLLSDLFSLAGCYAITAVDSFENESIFSDSVCVDNCPEYELPNVFSPDGNSMNDKFIPFPYKFIDKIDIEIYDRWGQLMFQTIDPDINWNGKYYKNNQDVSEGVFFYVCVVDMIRLSGIETKTLTGFIHLLRSNPGNNTN